MWGFLVHSPYERALTGSRREDSENKQLVKKIIEDDEVENFLRNYSWVRFADMHMGTGQNLLNAGLNPNHQDTAGYTALSVLSKISEKSCYFIDTKMEMVLEADADPDLEDGSTWTPLMTATAYGHISRIKLLLNAGARPAKTNWLGSSAITISMTRHGEDHEITLLLRSYLGRFIKSAAKR